MSIESEVKKLVTSEINKRNYVTTDQLAAAIESVLKRISDGDSGGVKLPRPGGKLMYDLIAKDLDPVKYNRTFKGVKWKKTNTGRPSAKAGTSQSSPNGYTIGHPIKYIPPQLVDGALRCFIDPNQKNYQGAKETHCHIKINPKGYSGGWIPAKKRHVFDLELTTHGNWKQSAALVWQLHPSNFGKGWVGHRQPPASLHLTKEGRWMMVAFGASKTGAKKYDAASSPVKKYLPHTPGRQVVRIESVTDHTGKNSLLRANVNGSSIEIAKVPMGIGLTNGRTFCSVGLYGGAKKPLAYVDIHRVRVYLK